jgi:hypothetical protein
LGVKGAQMAADLLRVSTSLTSVNLSSNNLAGETGYVKADRVQGTSFEVGDKVTYEGREMIISKGKDSGGDIKMIDLSGVKVLAEGIAVSASLTKISLAKNNLGEEGTKIICEAMKGNTTITELDLSGWGHTSNIGGAPGAKCVADMLRVTASLTSINLFANNLGPEGARALAPAIRDSTSLTYLSTISCGLNPPNSLEDGGAIACSGLMPLRAVV